jgi:hypothetical protein
MRKAQQNGVKILTFLHLEAARGTGFGQKSGLKTSFQPAMTGVK